MPEKCFNRRQLKQEKINDYIKLYSTHLKDVLSSDEHIYEWSARQTYIPLANMMTASAYIGIDSCPIEGFEKIN